MNTPCPTTHTIGTPSHPLATPSPVIPAKAGIHNPNIIGASTISPQHASTFQISNAQTPATLIHQVFKQQNTPITGAI